MDPEVSKESPDRGGRDSCARPYSADCHGTRIIDTVGESCLRPHSRLDLPPAARGREYDRPMAEGHQFADTPSGVSALAESVLGADLWARGYLAVSTGTLTDEMVKAYIAEQEGEPVHDDSRFVIDNLVKPPPSRRYVC